MASNFKLNRKGGAEVLNQLAAPHINALARQVAAAAGPDAEVDEYTTDRAAAAVRVPAEQQAKDGALTRAAATVGLEVRSK
ncbi:hypothetical protein ACQI4L_09080 [Mycolicibacterium litorale]|uniref:hypothetical protein n=1 Tax=Mycolicibacterium litorale TaxID=758802 RepID=UPI003CE83C00